MTLVISCVWLNISWLSERSGPVPLQKWQTQIVSTNCITDRSRAAHPLVIKRLEWNVCRHLRKRWNINQWLTNGYRLLQTADSKFLPPPWSCMATRSDFLISSSFFLSSSSGLLFIEAKTSPFLFCPQPAATGNLASGSNRKLASYEGLGMRHKRTWIILPAHRLTVDLRCTET